MKTRRSAQQRPLTLTATALALSALLASCGGGDSSGGIIGTGMTIDGTVPTNRAFASNDVMLKAVSGERTTASIEPDGRFSAEAETANGPYLMRVDLGNGNAYYSVAHLTGESTVQNIHAYSDVAIRNWFATQGLDIDATFDDGSAIAQLPTASEINAINGKVRDQVAGALASYGLGSTNLQNVVFSADDTGVDQFLDQNPILISNVDGNVSITIIIKDLDTDTQSTVVDGLPIDTDLTANDVIPPSAPTDLRVLPSASNEIVLAWNSATDNIGVTAYEVARDGDVIATTPFPVHIDMPLQSGVTYEYTVTALDASGNRSQPSDSGSSETLASPDTIAPPAPTGLQLISTPTSIDVRWVQSEIGDVASFRVLRAIDTGMLARHVSVSSTQLIDAGLNSGTNYCYQVIAEDASKNASDPSSKVCAVTNGENVTEQETVTPPDTNADGSNAHLLAVDVSSLACTTELDVDSLTGEARIPAGCYLVNDNVRLTETNLTIDAGVVLKFSDRAGISVSDDSSLTVNGTQAQPVVFTGQQRTTGYWSGVNFVFSNNVKNSLEHLVVEYAGTNTASSGAVSSNSSDSLTVRLKMANVLIRHAANYGFVFNEGTLLDRFDSITSTQNEQPGNVTPQIAGMFGSGLSMSGNNSDVLALSSDAIERTMSLPDTGVPYNAERLAVDAPVEISAGVTIQFAAGGQLRISQDGSLRVSGTAAKPVLFTGAQATPGYWRGVEFVFSNSTENDLQNLTIEYGGSGAGDTANLVSNSSPSLPVILKLDSVTLRNSISSGFYFREGTTLAGFDNIVSTQNDESGLAYPSQIASFGSANDFSGNTFDRVTLDAGTIEQAQSWPLLNVPVRFNRLVLENILTLPAGQEFIAGAGAQINVTREAGALTAIGSAAAPIIFRGEQQTPGYWTGINYTFSNNPLNVLDHVQISDAGSGVPASSGNILMRCSVSLPATLSISNAFISNSASWGLLASEDGCTVNVGSNVTYSNNAQGNISN